MQQLAIETCKVKMRIFPIIMKEIFNFIDNNNYNIRSGTHLSRPTVNTARNAAEFLTNLGAKICELLYLRSKLRL